MQNIFRRNAKWQKTIIIKTRIRTKQARTARTVRTTRIVRITMIQVLVQVQAAIKKIAITKITLDKKSAKALFLTFMKNVVLVNNNIDEI